MHEKNDSGQEDYNLNTSHYLSKYNIKNDGATQGHVTGDYPIVHMHFHDSQREIGTSQQSSSNMENHSQISQYHSELRSKLLRTMRTEWIANYMEQYLGKFPPLTLRLREQPRTKYSKWSEYLLPADTRIEQVYRESSRQLLIQGGPGSGKTMLLLELARNLLGYAEQNEEAKIPIVLELATWRKNLSFIEWLSQELDGQCSISSKVLHSWIQENQLIFLLDGLDEVPENQINECIKTINEHQKEHGDIVPMVITSRPRDHLKQTIPLRLSRTVVVEPLEDIQINEYITTANSTLLPILNNDRNLQELARMPLMLNIMTEVYSDLSSTMLQITDIENRPDQQIFAKYVEHRLNRSDIKKRYEPQQLKTWLAWIAKQMIYHPQSIFRLDQLDKSQLSAPYAIIIAILQAFLLSSIAMLFPAILGIFAGTLIISLVMLIISFNYFCRKFLFEYGMVFFLFAVLLSGWLALSFGSTVSIIIAIFLAMILFSGALLGKVSWNPVVLSSCILWAIPIESILAAFFRALHNIILFLDIALSFIALLNVILIILTLLTFHDNKYYIKLLVYSIGICIIYSISSYALSLLLKGIFIEILLIFCSGVILFIEIFWLIQHVERLILLLFLWREGYCPLRYFNFLYSMVECNILRRSGRGFVFIHQLLHQYFSELEDSKSTPLVNDK